MAMTTTTEPVLVWDRDHSVRFLLEAADRAEREYAIDRHGAFELAVLHRLEVGQQLYGDVFLTRPAPVRVREIMEEAWDAAAYAAMDAQASLAQGDADSRGHHLFEIATHAAAIDWHARQLRRADL